MLRPSRTIVISASLVGCLVIGALIFVLRPDLLERHRGKESSEGPGLAARGGNLGYVATGYVDLEHGLGLLTPSRPGRVGAILAHEGDHVAAETALVQFDDRAARLQLRLAEKTEEAARARKDFSDQLAGAWRSLAQKEGPLLLFVRLRLAATRQAAQKGQEAASSPSADSAAGHEQVEQLELMEHLAREVSDFLGKVDPSALARGAEADLERAHIARELAQLELDECTLKAPSSGTVQRVFVGAGDVLAGTPDRPAIQFCPDVPRFIRAQVEQEFASRIAVGQTVTIEDDADAEQRWPGRVVRVADWFSSRRPDVNDPAQFVDVRTLECLITIDDQAIPLRIGQRVRVRHQSD